MVPKCSRDHVYIFIVHGMDPLDYANLTGLRDFIQELGFQKTYYGQMYHLTYFEHEIQRIHEEDPEARFVLIGFSFGANMVRFIAQSMLANHIHLDLLVYLGGNTLKNNEYDQPENAERIVNILASGAIWHGATMDRADNMHVPDVWHFGSPTHKATVEKLAHALAEVASSVPMTVQAAKVPVMPGMPEMAPTPRPVLPEGRQTDGDWNFLKPVTRLEARPVVSKPGAPATATPIRR